MRSPLVRKKLESVGQLNLQREQDSKGHLHVSKALLCDPLARHRWVNSGDALQSYSLLACVHNVLPVAVLLWLNALQSGQQPKDLPTPEIQTDFMMIDDAVLVGPSKAASKPGEVALGHEVVGEESNANAMPWTEWNQNQRNKAKRFAMSNPVAVLVIATTTIELAVHLLHIIERVGSENFELQQEWQKLKGKPGKPRVHELAGSKLQKHMHAMAEDLLDSPQKYAALPQAARTWRSQGTAFALISTSLAAMEHYLWRPLQQFPLILFKLLDVEEDRDKVAADVLGLPVCLRDTWSARFLQEFPTRSCLCSRRCLLTLYSLALTLRFDIIGLECRHASVRRLQRNRSCTHLAEVTDVSAEFTLQAFRVAGGGLDTHPLKEGDGPVSSAMCGANKRKRRQASKGGGGVQRACVADILRERPALDKKVAFRLAHARLHRVRETKGPEWQALLERGRRATLLHRHGVRHPRRRLRGSGLAGPLKKAKQVLLATQPALSLADDATHSAFPSQGDVILQSETIHSAARVAASNVADCRGRLKEERDQIAKVNDDLQAYSSRQALAHPCSLHPDVPRSIRPQGDLQESLSLQVEKFVAPVGHYAQAVFESKADIQQDLLDLWSMKHIPFRHQDAESGKTHMGRLLADVTVCMRAGFCCCGDAPCQRTASALASYVSKHCAKKSATKALMDSRKAVLLVERGGLEHFYHIAYVNRKHHHFIFLHLQPVDAEEEWFRPPEGMLLLSRPAKVATSPPCWIHIEVVLGSQRMFAGQ